MTEPLIEAAKCIETAEECLTRAYRMADGPADFAALGQGYAMLAMAYHGQISAESTIKLEGAMTGMRGDIKSTTARQMEVMERIVPPPEDLS